MCTGLPCPNCADSFSPEARFDRAAGELKRQMTGRLQEPSPVNEPPVIAQRVGSLESGMHELHNVLGRLEDRLGPVLTPEDTDTGINPTDPRRQGPLAGDLDRISTGMVFAIQRVHRLMGRLEL